MIEFSALSAVVLDIEGTTCPVDFVADTLFPYAANHLQQHLQRHGETDALQQLLQLVWDAWAKESDPDAPPLPPGRQPTATVPYLQWLIIQNRKFTPLKDLQGQIWADGYSNGNLLAPLYIDVAPALGAWRQQGIQLAVYSSGSVQAQQLLYGHTSDGDLRNRFERWYDTKLGPKRQSSSYIALCADLDLTPATVLFISDSNAELAAAAAAGLQVCGCQRPGNPEPIADQWPAIQQFADLALKPSAV